SPWEYSGGRPDDDAQAKSFDAMFTALSDQEWWIGTFMWKTFTDAEPAKRRGNKSDFRFLGYPGGDILSGWYKKLL
ncbi:MAG: hypothetical protein JKX97_07675, partial [Candidatus Lindowbacteria bacterium]|nr:hypothetical protein [Candidatus Lindowbacteria bacterium]